MDTIVVSIDHGNKGIKVVDKNNIGWSYESGYTKSNTEPIIRENLLVYNNMYYTLGNRFSVQMDKSQDERFFILSLPAISYAMDSVGVTEANIILAVGLPICSYGVLKEKFRDYFIRSDVTYEFSKRYNINIISTQVYPQGYGAFISVFNDYKDVSQAVGVDIGAFTTDCFEVQNGKLIISSAFSIDRGVIKLFKEIQKDLLKYDLKISETQIQDILTGKGIVFLQDDIKAMIVEKAAAYVNDLLDEIKENGIELRNPSLFIGGGSKLLWDHIKNNRRLQFEELLDDPEFGNARGFALLAKKSLMKKGN